MTYTEVGRSESDLHTWFGLSYSSYLAVAESHIAQMPPDWQHAFQALVTQFRSAFAHVLQPSRYLVVPAEEWQYEELSTNELRRLKITYSASDPVEDDATVEEFYTDADGQQHSGWERLMVDVEGATPIPAVVLPRTLLQNMPLWWQEQMVELLHQIEATVGDGVPEARVEAQQLVDGEWKRVLDPLAHYRHAPRIEPHLE